MTGFELVMVILFLLGILTVSIRQHLWIWRLDQTTPNDTETVRRLFFFLRKIKPEPWLGHYQFFSLSVRSTRPVAIIWLMKT